MQMKMDLKHSIKKNRNTFIFNVLRFKKNTN